MLTINLQGWKMPSQVVVMLIALMRKERVRDHCVSVTDNWPRPLPTLKMIGSKIIIQNGETLIGRRRAEHRRAWDGERKQGQCLVITAVPEEISRTHVVERKANCFLTTPILAVEVAVGAERLTRN